MHYMHMYMCIQLDFSDNIRRPLQFGFKSEPEDFELVCYSSNK